jgi:hypothetical protein
MFKRLLTYSLMVVLMVSLSACLDFLSSDDEEDDNPLIGQWVIYRYVEKEYEDNVMTDETDQIYSGEWDNFHSAWFLVFTEDMLTWYENDDSTEYYHEEFDYEHKKGKIVVDDEETSYEIRDGMLVIPYIDEWEWDGVTYKWETTEYYKKYDGDIPPASWTQAIAADSYEDDDVYSDATPMTVNSAPQNHTITKRDNDWYSFTATSGQNYLLILGSGADLVITLFDMNGTSYLDDDDDNDYNIEPNNFNYPVESVLFWTAPASGTYYFRVTGFDSSDEGYYVVTVVETTMTSPFGKAVVNDEKESRSRRHFLKTR